MQRVLGKIAAILVFCMFSLQATVTTTYWDTTYNFMTFNQEGSSAYGEYIYDGGVLTGTMDGNLFTGWWREDGNSKSCGPSGAWSGPARFVFADDFISFTGSWGYCSTTPEQLESGGSTWNGTRNEEGLTQATCESVGRYWCNGSCQIQACGTEITQSSCESVGWFWCDGSCQIGVCAVSSVTVTTPTTAEIVQDDADSKITEIVADDGVLKVSVVENKNITTSSLVIRNLESASEEVIDIGMSGANVSVNEDGSSQLSYDDGSYAFSIQSSKEGATLGFVQKESGFSLDYTIATNSKVLLESSGFISKVASANSEIATRYFADDSANGIYATTPNGLYRLPIYDFVTNLSIGYETSGTKALSGESYASVSQSFTSERDFIVSERREGGEVSIVPSEASSFSEKLYLEDGSIGITMLSGSATFDGVAMVVDEEVKIEIATSDAGLTPIVFNNSYELAKGWNLITALGDIEKSTDSNIAEIFTYDESTNIWKSIATLLDNTTGWVYTVAPTEVAASNGAVSFSCSENGGMWRLVGAVENISFVDIASCAKDGSVYLYQNGEWILNPSQLFRGMGVWIK